MLATRTLAIPSRLAAMLQRRLLARTATLAWSRRVTGRKVVWLPITPIQILCNDQNVCTADSCDASVPGGLRHNVSMKCAVCESTTCPATTNLCFPTSRISNCATAGVVNITACQAAVAANGTYCQTVDIQATQCAPKNDACSTYNCDSARGLWVATQRSYRAPNNCTLSVCSLATGGCVNSDRCIGAVTSSKLFICDHRNKTTLLYYYTKRKIKSKSQMLLCSMMRFFFYSR